MLRTFRWPLLMLVLMCAGLVPAPSVAAAAPQYPVAVGPTGRYLVDQNGVPFLIVGESPQSMIGDVSLADAELFFADRQSRGFNTVWINLLCVQYTSCNADGTTFDGIPPFTTPGDITTPNEAYFARADAVLRLAARYGFLVLLDPIETGGWLSVLEANGVDNTRIYGQYLGQRYANVDNILWMHGNDFQVWSFDPNADPVVQAVARGIQDFDHRHLHTVELDYYSSNSLNDATWEPLIQLNAAYTYLPTYQEVLKAYDLPNFLPTFMVEAGYEDEPYGGTSRNLRAQAYWSLLSGATGQLFGNHYTWQFIPGWKDQLDSVGANQFSYVTALFKPRAWYDLVPDQAHALVTAGYGTSGADDYVAAAKTPSGDLAIAYLPFAGTIIVDMTIMSGAVTARWYDPAAGTFEAIPGSPFSNTSMLAFTSPGNNADGLGNPDWVLVLEVLGAAAPTLTAIAPTQVTVGGPDFTLIATGANFDSTSVVRVDGSPRSTMFTGSSTQLTATITAADLALVGTLNVTVSTPGGGTSAGRSLAVRNPVASLTGIDPSSVLAGGATFTLTLTGDGFVPSSVVRWKGANRTTTFVSSTQLTASIPASDIVIVGSAALTVFTPPPGGGTSASKTFTVAAPGSVAFTSATAAVDETAGTATLSVIRTGGAGILIVAYGTQDGTALAGQDYDATIGTLTFAAAGSQTIAVPILATIGGSNKTFAISLSSPQTGLRLGTPSATTVTIRNVATTITGFTPVQGPIGTIVAIAGKNLQLTTAARFNGINASTFTLLTPTSIRATVPPGATTGPISLISPVSLPTSGGAFKVIPKITSVAPDAGVVGTTVTLTGTTFTGVTAVKFGTVIATDVDVADDNTITATVPVSAVTAPLSVTAGGVTVMSPAPYLVVRPPTITSFSPLKGPEGTAVTINGANLTSATVVTFTDVDAGPVTIVSAAALRAIVPAGATTGVIRVINPAGNASSLAGFQVSPRIRTVTPSKGTPGTAVTITGTTLTNATVVRFGSATATATTLSVDTATQITATVPPAAVTGPVSVTTPTGTGTSSTSFTVIGPPTVTSFTPSSGPVGTTVTMSGANLGTVTSVTFNGINANPVTVLSPTSVQAVVPDGATTGRIGVVNSAKPAQSIASFAVTPSIVSLVPARGVPGTTVVIAGTTFGNVTAVRFGTAMATNFSVDPGAPLITTTVPPTATSGPVSVTTPAGIGVSRATFTVVRPPTIARFTPARGPIGTAVMLVGANLDSVTAVDFNGINASPATVLSPTSMRVVVPDGAATGRIHVSNEADPMSPTMSTIDFVVAPRLLTMTPARGQPGDTVTLAGSTLAGATAVRFGGVLAAPPTANGDTEVTVTVPPTAVTGPVSVTTPGGTATSTTNFAVIRTPAIASFTPGTAPEGAPVTLIGANLASVSAVTFSGVNATPVTVLSAASVRVVVPPGATTGRIGVVNEAGNALSAATFAVAPRVLQTPASGLPNTLVVVTGTSLTNASVVRFGAVAAAEFTVDSPGEITARVPSTATTGRITVTTPGGTATSPSDFAVIRAPVVTSFTPAAGQVGTLVTIIGPNVGSATDVTFGGATVTAITPLSPTSVRVPVPPGALTGPVKVTNAANSAQSAGYFTTIPRITGFGAPSGSDDRPVTLLGTSFTGVTAVKFGTVLASFTLVSDSEIMVIVPAAAVTGHVSVTTPGGTATSSVDFVVTTPGPSS